MKKLLLIIAIAICSFGTQAQTKTAAAPDVILKTNGEELKGKITKINDDGVSFVYTGETLEYAIKK